MEDNKTPKKEEGQDTVTEKTLDEAGYEADDAMSTTIMDVELEKDKTEKVEKPIKEAEDEPPLEELLKKQKSILHRLGLKNLIKKK